MAYALNTTKRKFHRILDTLTNISSTSLADVGQQNDKTTNPRPVPFSSTTESPAKRARLDRPVSITTSLSVQSLDPGITPTIRTVSGSSTLSTSSTLERKTPSFAPWDRSLFLSRLETFRHVNQWAPKPDDVNEVQWAKRGWRCVGVERVGCVTCGKVVVLKLETNTVSERVDEDVDITDEEWCANVEEQLAQRYSRMIVSEHDENCPWRRRGCDDSIYRLPLIHPSTSIPALRKRYDTLAKLSAALPTNITLPPNFNLDMILSSLPAVFFTAPVDAPPRGPSPTHSPAPAADIHTVAFALALFGWEPVTEDALPSSLDLITCRACFRRLGLWLFRPRTKRRSDLPAKLIDEVTEPVMSTLDVTQHRDYCPWVNALSQNGGPPAGSTKQRSVTDNLCGWEIQIRVLKNTYHFQTSTSPTPSSSDQLATPSKTARSIRAITPDRASSSASMHDIGFGGSSSPKSMEERDAKDKERFARLRKIKKMFDVSKGGGKALKKARESITGSPSKGSSTGVRARSASPKKGQR